MKMKQRLYITLEKEEIEKLKVISKKNKRSMSNMIGFLISEYDKK